MADRRIAAAAAAADCSLDCDCSRSICCSCLCRASPAAAGQCCGKLAMDGRPAGHAAAADRLRSCQRSVVGRRTTVAAAGWPAVDRRSSCGLQSAVVGSVRDRTNRSRTFEHCLLRPATENLVRKVTIVCCCCGCCVVCCLWCCCCWTFLVRCRLLRMLLMGVPVAGLWWRCSAVIEMWCLHLHWMLNCWNRSVGH